MLNLSDWPSERIAGFKALLKGGTVIPSEKEAISIIRSLPHGHVAAALGTARRIGLDRLIGPDGNRRRDLVLALAVTGLETRCNRQFGKRFGDQAYAIEELVA